MKKGNAFSVSGEFWKSCNWMAWITGLVVALLGTGVGTWVSSRQNPSQDDISASLQHFVENAILLAQKDSSLPLDETLRQLGQVKRPNGIEYFVFDPAHTVVYSSRTEMGRGLDFSFWLVAPDLTLAKLVAETPPGGSRFFDARLQPLRGWKPEAGLGFIAYIPGSSHYIVAHREVGEDLPTGTRQIVSDLAEPAIVSTLAGLFVSLSILIYAKATSGRVQRIWESSESSAVKALTQAINGRSAIKLAPDACEEMKALFKKFEPVAWQIKRIHEQESRVALAELAARTVLNSMDRAVFVLDRQGLIIWANHTAKTLLELSASAILNTPLTLYSGEEGGEIAIQSGLSAAWEGNGGFFMWTCRRAVSGLVIPVEVWANRISIDATEAMCVAIHDVSMRQKNEAELKRTVQDLQIAMEREYVSARSQRMFLARMSHEIRAPLNAVIGTCQIDRGAVGPAAIPTLERIEASAKDLLRVIDDMLECAKLEQGKIPLLLRPFQLATLLHEVCRFCRIRAAGKPLHFETKVDASLPEVVVGDAGRIKQVLINFCENAIKFTQAGVITLEATRDVKEAELLHFRVVDTGIGISTSKQHQLFQEFSQADQSIGRIYGGSGLGLSICKMLVYAMEGHIGFESVEGRGSKFWFEIPLEAGCLPQPTGEESPSENEAINSLRGKRILVVDDEDINRQVVSHLLSGFGCPHVVCSDGTEAFEKVLSQEFDLAILDLEMPETDGFRVLETIRRLPGSRGQLPAVAMSSHMRDYVFERVVSAGFSDYVTKPIESSNLRSAILRVVGCEAVTQTSPLPDCEPLWFDSASGLRRLGNDNNLYHALTHRFKTRWCSDTGYLTSLLRVGDSKSVGAAHKLRGAAALIGANEVAAIATRIESLARAGEDPSVEIDALENALAKLASVLDSLADTSHSSSVPTSEHHE